MNVSHGLPAKSPESLGIQSSCLQVTLACLVYMSAYRFKTPARWCRHVADSPLTKLSQTESAFSLNQHKRGTLLMKAHGRRRGLRQNRRTAHPSPRPRKTSRSLVVKPMRRCERGIARFWCCVPMRASCCEAVIRVKCSLSEPVEQHQLLQKLATSILHTARTS